MALPTAERPASAHAGAVLGRNRRPALRNRCGPWRLAPRGFAIGQIGRIRRTGLMPKPASAMAAREPHHRIRQMRSMRTLASRLRRTTTCLPAERVIARAAVHPQRWWADDVTCSGWPPSTSTKTESASGLAQ